jgi:predicted GNAT family acetyltransferase
VGHTALEPLRRAEILAAPWGSPEIADQLLAAKELLAQRVRLRCFAAFADGVVVSGTDLYEDGADGQIEDVATAPAYRGRGYGTDVVLTALAAAPEFCFLVARADDWPRRWYARLGFEPVGSYAKISAAT